MVLSARYGRNRKFSISLNHIPAFPRQPHFKPPYLVPQTSSRPLTPRIRRPKFFSLPTRLSSPIPATHHHRCFSTHFQQTSNNHLHHHLHPVSPTHPPSSPPKKHSRHTYVITSPPHTRQAPQTHKTPRTPSPTPSATPVPHLPRYKPAQPLPPPPQLNYHPNPAPSTRQRRLVD